MSSGLLQVFVELWSLHGTSRHVLYLITRVACSDSVNISRVYVLSIPVVLLTCSKDLTCNLQMIFSLMLREPTRITITLCALLDNNTGILCTYTRLCLTESEISDAVDDIKDVDQSSV